MKRFLLHFSHYKYYFLRIAGVLIPVFILNLPATAKECSSDYDCEYSQKCVKTGYDFRGICSDVTDSYGNKSYQYRPNPKSIGGNEGRGDCRYDSHCNYGFVCYKANPYDALGYCLKK